MGSRIKGWEKQIPIEKIVFHVRSQVIFYIFLVMFYWVSHSDQKKKLKTDEGLKFLILFTKYLITKEKYIKRKENVRHFNVRYWIFKYSFRWTHIQCGFQDSKSFDTLSTCFLKFADHSNGLALFYFPRFLEYKYYFVSEVSATTSLLI